MTINWHVERSEMLKIVELARKAVSMADTLGVQYSQRDAVMDLTACHANGCPLLLDDMLADNADQSSVYHDLFGIRKHIDRETGKLGDCFVPRYAR